MACTTEYGNLMVTKRKALSSARCCRSGGILTNGLRRKLEDDARATIASIIKKYSGSCFVNGYHQPTVLPPPLLKPLKNGLNGTAKHFIGTISYKEAITKYIGKQEERSKTKSKDKKLKKRVSFGPATIKIFGESDYYDGEKELIKKELAAQTPRNLKKALRDHNKKKTPVTVTGRRSSFHSAQTQIKHQTMRQKPKIKFHARKVLSKIVNYHNRTCSPGRSPKVKVGNPSLQVCAKSIVLGKSSKCNKTQGMAPKQEWKGQPPEIKKGQDNFSVILRHNPIILNPSEEKLLVKDLKNSEVCSKTTKLPDKALETEKCQGQVSKCQTNKTASNIFCKKLPKIPNNAGKPLKNSKIPGISPKMTKSSERLKITKRPGRPKITKRPGRPKITKRPGRPKITKRPGRPKTTKRPSRAKITKIPSKPSKTIKSPSKPKMTKHPGKLPQISRSPGRPKIANSPGRPLKISKSTSRPNITKSPGRPPKTKNLGRPPKLAKGPGRPPKITKSPGKPPKIARKPGRPRKITESPCRPAKVTKHLGKPPKTTKNPGRTLKITKSPGRPPQITKSPGTPFKNRGPGRPPKIIKARGRPSKLAKSCNKLIKNNKRRGRPFIIKRQKKTPDNTTTRHERPPKNAKGKAKPRKISVKESTTKKNNAQIAKLYVSCEVTYKMKKNSAYLTPYKRRQFLKTHKLLKKIMQSQKS